MRINARNYKGIAAAILSFILAMPPMGTVMAHEHVHHHPPAVAYDENVATVELSNKEWKALLPHEQYVILRKKGTERAFTGKYDKFYEQGTYICAGCGNPLFDSSAKFDSGTGWPSYYQPVSPNSISTKDDRSLFFMPRTEVLCKRCGGHLGHVFNDGPQPTGLRYCINSGALSFVERQEE